MSLPTLLMINMGLLMLDLWDIHVEIAIKRYKTRVIFELYTSLEPIGYIKERLTLNLCTV